MGNREVVCVRANNPHAGCFLLSAEQMEHWADQPHFLDRKARFVGPLESAATLGILRTFRIYKPSPQNANFLEIEHAGNHWIHKFDRRDRELQEKPHRRPQNATELATVPHNGRPVQATTARPVLIQSMMMAPGACEWVRVRDPEAMLRTIAGVRTLTETKRIDFSAARPEEDKVLIWQRPILEYPKSLPWVRDLLQRGYLIVVEYDDDPSRREEHLSNDYFTFRACHCVQVSTEPLAEFIRQFNPHVAVHANQIAHLPPPRVYGDTQEVHVFYGALHRQEDWQPLMQSLNGVIAQRRDHLRFHVVFDREFFEALDTPHKDFVPLCPYLQYSETLGGCDIGLLPLRPTHMNRMKSDLKFIEHAAYGVAALASPTVYEHTLRDGVTGLLFHSPQGFREKLVRLIEDEQLRRRLAANAYNYVRRERQLSQHYRARYDWLLQMRDALPWLTAQLKSRVPELI
jgi:hypothetical protein